MANEAAPKNKPLRIFDISSRIDGRHNVWELMVDPRVDLSAVPVDEKGRHPEYIQKSWVNIAVFGAKEDATKFVKQHGVVFRPRPVKKAA